MVLAINETFRDMIYKDLIIYIDNIIFSSRNYKQHVEALRKVLQRLQDQRFWLKESKCQFFTIPLDILEHILRPAGLSADPLKLQEIFDFPEPRDKKQLQAFIGIVNYLSKLLPNLARAAAILTDLQGTTRPSRWMDTNLEIFDHCQELINNRQVIKPWDNTSEESKYLICDAIDIGLGSWLEQGTLNRVRPAKFHSHKFNPV